MLSYNIEKQTTWKFENEISRFSLHYYSDDPDVVYFFSLFVDEKYRKQGLGNAILEYAEQFAVEHNFKKISLKVEENTWMYEWYKRKGYIDNGEKTAKYIWLEKIL